jgi:3-hydroxyisobutyrate dehydrogenase-like beta-hydroxyacid dehydrogenase
MGYRMAALAARKQTSSPLVVFNRTQEKAKQFVQEMPNAVAASSLADVSASADVIHCCVGPTKASWQILLGLRGLIKQARPGTVIIDHSTVDLETTMECHEFARSHGVHFLDAPVSGGPEGAAAGTLTMMVGGDKDVFEQVLPHLQTMSPSPKLMGAAGAGTMAKLVNQLLTSVHTAATAEAMTLAAKFRLNPQSLIEMVEQSFGGSRMFSRNAPLMAEHGRDKSQKSATPLKNLAKDTAIIRELSSRHNISLPQLDAAHALLQQAVGSSYGDSDISFLSEAMESAASTRLLSSDMQVV